MPSRLDKLFRGSGRPLTGRQILLVVGFFIAMTIGYVLIYLAVRWLFEWMFPVR